MRPILAAAAALLFVSAADQDQRGVPHLGETVEVSIVNLDVVVTDKNGGRVRGLTKDDFEIFENGVRQPITNFAEYASGEGPPQAPAPSVSRPKRTMIVFVDRFHLPKLYSDPFFTSMKELLHKTILGGDTVMIVSWYGARLRMRQPFTNDLAALDRSIDEIAIETTAPAVDDYRQAKDDAEMMREFEEQALSSLQNSPAQATDSTWAAEMEARTRAKKAQLEQRRKVEALKALMRAVSADDGKKIMLLATHRLSRVVGAEYFYAASPSPFGSRDTDLEFNAAADLKSLYETANASGVTMYTMYPEGLRDASTLSDATARGGVTAGVATQQQIQALILANETSAISEIAQQTGGVSAFGPDAARLLPSVADDLETYYSLAYRLRSGKEDRARNIVVKTKNPQFVARSRREYVEKSDATRMEDRVISALFRSPPPASFRIAVVLGEPKPQGKQVLIPVKIQIPISALTTLPQNNQHAGAFSVYLAWGTKSQIFSNTSHETKSFQIPGSEIARARQSYYSYSFDLAGDAQTDRIAIGVLDEVSKEYSVALLTFRIRLPEAR